MSTSLCSSWKPIRWWNATEPRFTGEVTADQDAAASATLHTDRNSAPREARQRYLPGQAAATVTRTDALPSVACRAVTVTWPVLPGTDRTNAPPTPP